MQGRLHDVSLSFLLVGMLPGKKPKEELKNAVTGESMSGLIYQPSGCGEENMIHLTMPVIATTYLDMTYQWEAVGVERRDEALQHIITGGTNKYILL